MNTDLLVRLISLACFGLEMMEAAELPHEQEEWTLIEAQSFLKKLEAK
jgi:hypothetical protein